MINLLKDAVSRNRILAAAIFFSLVCHLFWLSAVKVVVKPDRSAGVRFSKVSSFGRVLERKAIELGVSPDEISFLERRYRTAVDAMADREAVPAGETDLKFDAGAFRYFATDESMAAVIDNAVSGPKLEPD